MIIRARIKPFGSTKTEFISIKSKIRRLIENNPLGPIDFVIDDGGKKIKTYGEGNIDPDLVNTELPIISNEIMCRFNEDGSMSIIEKSNEGALPRKQTVDQLKKLRKLTKGIDISDRGIEMKNGNLISDTNPTDRIESYEDFSKKNKNFIPGWNTKGLLSPFKKLTKK